MGKKISFRTTKRAQDKIDYLKKIESNINISNLLNNLVEDIDLSEYNCNLKNKTSQAYCKLLNYIEEIEDVELKKKIGFEMEVLSCHLLK